MPLFALPQEILYHIFSHLLPVDIVHVGQTCRGARDIIVPENKLLWQSAFLQIFDDPQLAWADIPRSIRARHVRDVEESWDWYRQLRRRRLALKAVTQQASGNFEWDGRGDEGREREFTSSELAVILLEIIDTAKSRPTPTEIANGVIPQADDRSSLNLALLSSRADPWIRMESLIHDQLRPRMGKEGGYSFTAEDEGRPVTRSVATRRQQECRRDCQKRLHVLYGRTSRDKLEHGAKGFARRIVYDWSRPVVANDYGPLKADGSGEIDWDVLEATMSVILRVFDTCVEGRVAVPPGFCYAIPHRTLNNPDAPEDWAGVTGPWVGTYSFLDYTDLFHFNTTAHTYNNMSLQDVPEACGDLMRLDFKLDPSLADDPTLRSDLPSCDDLPLLHFSGRSSSVDPFGNPRLPVFYKGRVSLCPGGREVRWRYIISYSGHEQWVLEGVQPGGVRSGPVYGTWTQWGHEEHSPVGAFMYVQEELCKRQELVLSRRA